MPERVRKPEWLKISIGANERYTETKRIVESHCLHTICSSGRCPNMGECWGTVSYTHLTLPTNREVEIYGVALYLKKKKRRKRSTHTLM